MVFSTQRNEKLISWNVNGLRSVLRKDFIQTLKNLDADVVCLQEIRSFEDDLPDAWLGNLPYHVRFFPAQKKGYSGVATLSKREAQRVCSMDCESFDGEGRFQLLDFGDYVLINAYFPNSRPERLRLSYKLDFCEKLHHLADTYRTENRAVIVCGDYNIAHQSIDLKRPLENENSPGYYLEEREWMTLFLNGGYVDVFRKQNPHQTDQYTWWSYRTRARSRNIGWRIDYHCVSENFFNNVVSTSICSDIKGSDHCPVSLTVRCGEASV